MLDFLLCCQSSSSLSGDPELVQTVPAPGCGTTLVADEPRGSQREEAPLKGRPAPAPLDAANLRRRASGKDSPAPTSRSSRKTVLSDASTALSGGPGCARQTSQRSIRSASSWRSFGEEEDDLQGGEPLLAGEGVGFSGLEGVFVVDVSPAGDLATVRIPGVGDRTTSAHNLQPESSRRGGGRLGRPDDVDHEQGIRGLFQEFCDEARSGILVSLVDPETTLTTETMLRLDSSRDKISLQSAFAEGKVFRTRDLSSVFKGGAKFADRMPNLEKRSSRCLGLEFDKGSGRSVVLQFEATEERDDFFRCFKLLKAAKGGPR